MKELVSFSAYPFDLEPFGDWPSALAHWRSLGLDGLELLTSFDGVDGVPPEAATAVHLPYWMDWFHLWQGRPLPEDLGGEEPLFYFGGSSREELVANLARYLKDAASLRPEYAVFHLANAGADDILTNRPVNEAGSVLRALVELLTEACSPFGGGPPVRLFFENLWWPGLTFLDAGLIDSFAEALPFDDWAFLLDVGHLLNTTDAVATEEEAVGYVLDRLDALPGWVVDRIEGMHLHKSLSGPLRRSVGFFSEGPPGGLPLGARADRARRMLSRIDEHRPFETSAVRDLVERVEPRFITHELSAPTVAAKSVAVAVQRRALGFCGETFCGFSPHHRQEGVRQQ